MKLIDLSQPVYDGCPTCPTYPAVRSDLIARHERDGHRIEQLTLPSHAGSHVNAPLYRLPGKRSISGIPLESWIGEAFIVDLRGIGADEPISPGLLQEKLTQPLADRIVLLATGWGAQRAHNDHWHYHSPFLSSEAARWLVERQVRGVGIDHYSIGGPREPQAGQTCDILLGAKVWIVEELRFPDDAFAVAQPCQFWCLPVNLLGHSAAFCRPVIVAP